MTSWWKPVTPEWISPASTQVSDLHWLSYRVLCEQDTPWAAGIVPAGAVRFAPREFAHYVAVDRGLHHTPGPGHGEIGSRSRVLGLDDPYRHPGAPADEVGEPGDDQLRSGGLRAGRVVGHGRIAQGGGVLAPFTGGGAGAFGGGGLLLR